MRLSAVSGHTLCIENSRKKKRPLHFEQCFDVGVPNADTLDEFAGDFEAMMLYTYIV